MNSSVLMLIVNSEKILISSIFCQTILFRDHSFIMMVHNLPVILFSCIISNIILRNTYILNVVINIPIMSGSLTTFICLINLTFEPCPLGIGVVWSLRAADRPMRGRSGTASLVTGFTPPSNVSAYLHTFKLSFTC